MSHPYVSLSDADLWEHYRERGLSPQEATRHVQLRAQAREGAAAAEIARTESQDIGPLGTAAQAIFENSPVAAINAIRPTGELLSRVSPLVPGVSLVGTLASKVPSNLLQRGEAALAGMPYSQFAATEQASKQSNPVAAMTGPLGWLIAPGVALGGSMVRKAGQKAALKAAELERIQLANRILRQRAEQATSPMAGLDPARLGANAATYQRAPMPYGPTAPPANPMATPAPGILGGGTVAPEGPQVLGVTGTDVRPIPPEPPPSVLNQNPWADALDRPYVAKSYKELRALTAKGIPPEQIKIGYWTRGGRLEQSIPPRPTPAPKDITLGKSIEDLQRMLALSRDMAERALLRAAIIQRSGLLTR